MNTWESNHLEFLEPQVATKILFKKQSLLNFQSLSYKLTYMNIKSLFVIKHMLITNAHHSEPTI